MKYSLISDKHIGRKMVQCIKHPIEIKLWATMEDHFNGLLLDYLWEQIVQSNLNMMNRGYGI